MLASATTVDEALWLEARGVDAVIAQGLEAGGHRGHFLSHDLTRQAGLFALGAAAVQVGSACLRCPEATTSAVHRAALASDAALTKVFTARPARGIVNRLIRELGPLSDQSPAFPLAAAALAPLRAAAEAQGSGDFSPLWCGQNASGCRAAQAAEVTRALATR